MVEVRRSRFHARIGLERQFLTPVNQTFGVSAPLAGMTADAISSWSARARAVAPADLVEKVVSILMEASERAELLADDSKDVFVLDRLERHESLEPLYRRLQLMLAIDG